MCYTLSMEISISVESLSGKPTFNDYIHEINNLTGNISLHLDVMDGKFVPRVSITFDEYKYVVENSRHPIDVHLMIDDPESNINRYLAKAVWGTIRSISFHVESHEAHVIKKLMDKVRVMGIMSGIVIDLPTQIDEIDPNLAVSSDIITIMSVKCGASGQLFNQSALKKITRLRELNPDARIIMDGGITRENFSMVKSAGVHTAVMGSAMQRAENKQALIDAVASTAS